VRVRRRDLWGKFYADRGTHLAAMIAYFALLSFVPLTFLALSLLGLTGRADESSFLVKEIKHTLPGTPIDRIIGLVHTVQDNAAALGIVGGAALLWTSLSLFSVLESAFNIVYGRPNRSFVHGKTLATVVMVGSLVTLFVSLLVGSLGVSALKEYAPGFVGNYVTAYLVSIVVSMLGVFAFLVCCYYVLTNAAMTVREVLPGALLATVFLEGTFQVLPIYQRYADLNPGLRAFGAPAILLVWLYVMANVIVFGAELNWWRSRRREQELMQELPGLA
jgi:membrane protein